jgi:hypothetical protein
MDADHAPVLSDSARRPPARWPIALHHRTAPPRNCPYRGESCAEWSNASPTSIRRPATRWRAWPRSGSWASAVAILTLGKGNAASARKLVPITRKYRRYLEPAFHAITRIFAIDGSDKGCYRNQSIVAEPSLLVRVFVIRWESRRHPAAGPALRTGPCSSAGTAHHPLFTAAQRACNLPDPKSLCVVDIASE